VRDAPHDTRSFDGFAPAYDRYTGAEGPRLPRWIVDAIPSHGRRALDAGCGSGRYTLALAERFDHVIGVDLSTPLIGLARTRRSHSRVEYACGDLMEVEDAGGFDLVFTSTVLHHLPNLEAALRHLRGLVAPGGVAVLIDNVAVISTPPRWVYRLGSIRLCPADIRRFGWREARWRLAFRNSPGWLDHLTGERYLSRRAFEERYGAVFPGARFGPLGFAHAMVWRSAVA
jgi:SAM-dependent methyltransferase